jgi:hypothetical protein
VTAPSAGRTEVIHDTQRMRHGANPQCAMPLTLSTEPMPELP